MAERAVPSLLLKGPGRNIFEPCAPPIFPNSILLILGASVNLYQRKQVLGHEDVMMHAVLY